MTDIKIVIEPSELTDLYGVNNDNVSFLSRLFPQLKLVARGTELRAMGDEGQLEAFSAFFERMRQFLHKYGRLRTDDLLRLWEEDAQDIGEDPVRKGRKGHPRTHAQPVADAARVGFKRSDIRHRSGGNRQNLYSGGLGCQGFEK